MIFPAAILVIVNLAFMGGSSQAQTFPSADVILQNATANIPGLNVSAIPVEEAKTAFKKKCEINGGADAFNRTENAISDVQNCVRDLVNVTILQDEIEKAKPTGDLDTVFRRYCNKSPTVQNCVRNFTNVAESCFTTKERENIRIIQNITDSLLNFVCFKEGDRIALFIAAGGPECISSRQSAIQDCVNTTFGSYVPANGITPPSPDGLDNLPLLLLDTKECSDIEKLQTCVVKELETCSDPTPGNIVDSLFKFVKKVTPCENLLSKIRADASVGERMMSGSSAIIGAQFILVALSSLTLVRIARN